jgi:A/G-specific adenine glycosylase
MHDIYQQFNQKLLQWFDVNGRKDLPWQHPRCAYRVWISEIMLQQTQVKTVIPYFIKFITRFPNVNALSQASEDEVLSYWSGLGYYSRARNLYQTAHIICQQYGGEFPSEILQLTQLPGIGYSTAAAIASIAFEQPTAILDGNVRRVLSRYFLITGLPSQSSVKKKFWQIAQLCMPQQRCADYTQAIMDMGATCCTLKNPSCSICPLQFNCMAYQKQLLKDYPEKKPKKVRPTQYEQFLLLHTDDQYIYLERRPNHGIWGGLWCLPNINHDINPQHHVQNRYGMQTEAPQSVLNFKHSFTHFHLHIQSWSMFAHKKSDIRAEDDGRWFQAHEILQIGIAKPVRMIIDAFLTNTSRFT